MSARVDALLAAVHLCRCGAGVGGWCDCRCHADDERVAEAMLAGLGDDHRLVRTPGGVHVVDSPLSPGEQLDLIGRDLDVTGEVWAAAGYPYDGPEYAAREAVFARLRAWNAAAAAGAGAGSTGLELTAGGRSTAAGGAA